MTWLALLLPLLVPPLLTVAAGLLQQSADRLHPGAPLHRAAGRWLRDLVQRRCLPVGVEVHQSGIDAYWPGTGAIGLSQGTFCSQRPTAWAIAAHELGHAHTMASSPLAAELLPTARLVLTFARRAFVATLLVSLLFAEPAHLVLAAGLLLLTLAASATILVDEALASRFALQLLRDEALPTEALAIAKRSMLGAFAVYLTGFLGDLATTFSLAAASQLLPSLPAPSPPDEAWAPAVWFFVALVPVLLLRAAHVVHQVLRPEPVLSDFRLFTVMQREAQWEFLAGAGVFLVVVGLHDHAEGAWFQLSAVLALTTAVGPVGGLLRAIVLVPAILGLIHIGWLSDDDAQPVLLPEARDGDAAPALMALYSDPPWFLRVSWLAHTAYLPLLLLLSAALIQR